MTTMDAMDCSILGIRVSAHICSSRKYSDKFLSVAAKSRILLVVACKKRWRFSEKRWRFSEKRWRFSEKRWRFFGKRRSFWGVMAEKTLHRWGSGGKIGGKVRPIWCSFHTHLVQPSHPSDAAFASIWCNLHPKEGRINKPSALGLVGKICIFAATSSRCGAHRIVPSRVPRKALSTRRSLCPLPDHRWAATTSILILP